MSNESSKAVVGAATQEVSSPPMNPAAANEAVIREVSSWEGVTVHEHRFGGVEFRVARRELGHLHARFADLPFPRRVRDELVEAGAGGTPSRPAGLGLGHRSGADGLGSRAPNPIVPAKLRSRCERAAAKALTVLNGCPEESAPPRA
jgi:hypothetical protein